MGGGGEIREVLIPILYLAGESNWEEEELLIQLSIETSSTKSKQGRKRGGNIENRCFFLQIKENYNNKCTQKSKEKIPFRRCRKTADPSYYREGRIRFLCTREK